MRRVVITGMGIWSSIGQDLKTVTESLRLGRSGIVFDPSWVEYGLQSGLLGDVPRPDLKPYLSRRQRQMMSTDAEYAYMAARQAFEHANITEAFLQQNEVGIIFGNDGNSHQVEYNRIMEQEHCSALIGYNALFRSMTSSAVMNLSSLFHLRGINMTIGAACASSSQAIGLAYMYIRQGLQDVILAGGSSEINKENVGTLVNDALYTDVCYNEHPEQASRPFDKDAVGCIFTGGAAALVIEEYEHAINRGATILAEIVGYGFAGYTAGDFYLPNWESEYAALNMALASADLSIADVSFIHARAESFPLSDEAEARALKKICAGMPIPISTTEATTGHGAWMAGASRAVYSILMMSNDFIAPTINLEHPITDAENLNIIRECVQMPIETVLFNSAGIGGSCCALIFKKC